MSWLLGLVGIAVLSVLVDILLPEGQTNKFIKGIFSLLVVFVLISPLAKLKNADFDYSEIFASDKIDVSESYLQKANEREQEILIADLTEMLETKGIKVEKIVLNLKDGNINNIEKVSVQTTQTNLSEKVKELIATRLAIDKSLITVYE